MELLQTVSQRCIQLLGTCYPRFDCLSHERMFTSTLPEAACESHRPVSPTTTARHQVTSLLVASRVVLATLVSSIGILITCSLSTSGKARIVTRLGLPNCQLRITSRGKCITSEDWIRELSPLVICCFSGMLDCCLCALRRCSFSLTWCIEVVGHDEQDLSSLTSCSYISSPPCSGL